jgi:hypothetical protein
MGTDGVIILQIRPHEPSQMGFVEHDHPVAKLAA